MNDDLHAALLTSLIDRRDIDITTQPKFFAMSVHGIEVTQAIQYYHSSSHLTDPADRASDNAVTLIAGKPAWARVYVRAGIFGGNIPGVTGTLQVSRRILGFLYTSVTTLTAQPPGSVTARPFPDYATERGTLGYALNFILPADLMCGHLRLRALITAPDGRTAERTVYVTVTLRQTLRLAGIMVSYNGPTSTAPGAPTVNLPAPTVADLQTTSGWTLLAFPVRSFATYRSAGTINWTQPLTDPPSCAGCCTPNWVALNAAVQTQKVADGNRSDVLYYGLLPSTIPRGPIIGCESSGVSSGANGDGITMGHELGHHCGLPHAPCGFTTNPDPLYPAYEPYDPAGTPQASIGEYGLDISNGNIFSPATFKDVMSYCGPRWISLFNYARLTNNSNLDPVSVCVDHWWWRDYILYDPILIPEKWLPDPPPEPVWRQRFVQPEPLISVIGILHSPENVEVKSVVRLEAQRDVSNGRQTAFTAELVNADGRVVASGALYQLTGISQGGCGSGGHSREVLYPHVFQAFLSNAAPGATLRIRRGEKEVWSRHAPAHEPAVSDFKATVKKDELVVEWRTKCGGEEEPEGWLQWSGDRGKTWSALTTGLRGESATVDASALPSGRVTVRLLLSDGFYTAESKRVRLEVPKRPPAVSILSPREGQPFVAGGPMRLLGAVTPSLGENEKAARWLIDEKEVAEGLDAFVTAPRAGEHRATLVVEKTPQRVKFVTIELPEEPQEPC